VAKSICKRTRLTTKKKSLLSAGDYSKFTHHTEQHTREEEEEEEEEEGEKKNTRAR
jgi:hypothetical protein